MNNDLIELVTFSYEWQAQIFSQILNEESIEHYMSETTALQPAIGYTIYINSTSLIQSKELLRLFDESVHKNQSNP